VSGSLHIGHVFSYTTDTIARFHGCAASGLLSMGFDDNGSD